MRKGIQAIENGLAQESHLQDDKNAERLHRIRQAWGECPVRDVVVGSLQVALKHTYKSNTLTCISDVLSASLTILPLQSRSQAISGVVSHITEYYMQRTKASAQLIQSLLTELLGPLVAVTPRLQGREITPTTWFALEAGASSLFNRSLTNFVAQFKSQVFSK